MTENNELNDIILNKGNSASSNKKIILAVATLGVVLIIVVMLMNSLSSSSNENLPQAVLPPKPQIQKISPVADEPLFEEVEVVNDSSSSDADLDEIAKKLKAESLNEEVAASEVLQTNEVTTIEPEVKMQKPVATVAPSKHQKTTTPKAVTKGTHYVQVGSFSKYKPNKKFLSKITKLGYGFTYHKVGSLNKVLVGPFKTTADAKKARKVLRSKVEPGAFLVHL